MKQAFNVPPAEFFLNPENGWGKRPIKECSKNFMRFAKDSAVLMGGARFMYDKHPGAYEAVASNHTGDFPVVCAIDGISGMTGVYEPESNSPDPAFLLVRKGEEHLFAHDNKGKMVPVFGGNYPGRYMLAATDEVAKKISNHARERLVATPYLRGLRIDNWSCVSGAYTALERKLGDKTAAIEYADFFRLTVGPMIRKACTDSTMLVFNSPYEHTEDEEKIAIQIRHLLHVLTYATDIQTERRGRSTAIDKVLETTMSLGRFAWMYFGGHDGKITLDELLDEIPIHLIYQPTILHDKRKLLVTIEGTKRGNLGGPYRTHPEWEIFNLTL